MKDYKFGYIGAFVEFETERVKREGVAVKWFWVCLCLALCGLVFATWRHEHQAGDHKPVMIEAPFQAGNAGDTALWNAWISAARVAADKWRASGVDPGVIKLTALKSMCPPNVIAFSIVAEQTVYVCQDRADVDRVTIMMHEIGHLFGVPHIEGDPLMDPAYQERALDRPTEAAIAVARIKQGLTVTGK